MHEIVREVPCLTLNFIASNNHSRECAMRGFGLVAWRSCPVLADESWTATTLPFFLLCMHVTTGFVCFSIFVEVINLLFVIVVEIFIL